MPRGAFRALEDVYTRRSARDTLGDNDDDDECLYECSLSRHLQPCQGRGIYPRLKQSSSSRELSKESRDETSISSFQALSYVCVHVYVCVWVCVPSSPAALKQKKERQRGLLYRRKISNAFFVAIS